MTDERAILLANLLGEYMVDSRDQGVSAREVANLTAAEIVADVVESTPKELEAGITNDARILLNDFTPWPPAEYVVERGEEPNLNLCAPCAIVAEKASAVVRPERVEGDGSTPCDGGH